MKNKSNVMAIIFIFAMMVLVATIENVRGVFIPAFKREFSINDASIGLMITASSLGYILSTFIGGGLCERLGQKKVFMLGFIFLIASLGLLSVTYVFPLLLIAMFIMNVGLALTGIATNTLVPILFMSFQAVLMNVTHFCYGLGSTIAQRTSGILISNGISWRTVYLAEAVIAMVFLILLMFIKMPETHKNKHNKVANNLEIFRNKLFYFYAAGLGFYVFAEIATATWFVNFMNKVYNYNESRSSFYLALFFGIFTVGRLLGGFVVEKTGYLNTVIVSLIIALVLFSLGIFMGQQGMIIISISGLFFAIGFPTIVLSVRKVFKENPDYTTGAVITFASTINMIMNFFMGILNDKVGAHLAFYIIPISLMLSIVNVYIIYRNTKECFSI